MRENFQLVAGHIALDFANTLDWRFDPKRRIDLLPNYQRLLAFATQAGTISPTQGKQLLRRQTSRESAQAFRLAITLREAIDSVFRSIARGETLRRDSLQTLNDLFCKLRQPESVVRQGSEFVLRPSDWSDRSDGPLWPIADAAVRLLTSMNRLHVRECNDRTCRWLFLDTSKNHSRQWCS